ncbi:glycosyl transferase family 2 [Rhodovulum imhoffii]|uniref:Glycosyl transferase family 2 n=1 Tax=Rhodovulum imhoffii TaxID=365340 RepID=A0A2T5BUX7_9RHOB|nr:glycosyltransferase family 2 protein [Rhodovulum imhoffii]MBK5934922.1 glycosyl transferase family 2 [Rhodovulum imhoffii]PTN03324.1 glycosyl transferase family 2 [Rhodovulum imhoffii]
MPKQTYTLISTMKNEGPFILEWIAHYKALGFDYLVVQTNDCEDTTVDILKALERRGLAIHRGTRVWSSTSIHRAALKQAQRNPEVQQADWIFVCDADEYLNVHVGDGSVQALVAAAGEGADVISVPWRVFGPSGVHRFVDRPVTEQFTMAEHPPEARPEAGKFMKSLFTGLPRFKRVGLHAPIPKDDQAEQIRVELPGGVLFAEGESRVGAALSFEAAQVNHYALRSGESFLVKRARGRANHMTHTLGMDYWARFDLNHEHDDSIRRYDPLARVWLDELMGDPELRDLHEKSVAWYHDKIKALRADPELAEFVAAVDSQFSETA